MKRKLVVVLGKSLLSIILLYAVVIVGSIILQFIPGETELGLLSTPIGLMVSAWLMYVWFEKKKAWPMGWQDRKSVGNFLMGGSIAAIVIALSVSIILFTGNVDVQQMPWSWNVVLFQTILFLSVAIGEEWLFRGYLYGIYKEAIGIRSAVFINSAIFTVIHLVNPEGLTRPIEYIVIEMVNIFLLAVLMSQARLFSGSLWMPIGLHFMLNFFQSSIFGFKNGGKEVESLFQLTYGDASIWNGASYGLESSLAFTPVLLIIVAVYGWLGRGSVQIGNSITK